MTKQVNNTPANTHKSGRRGGKTKTSWKPGQSGNPAGAPKRGESWAELIKSYGDMTPEEIANKAKEIAGQLKKIGGSISMREAVIIRVYAQLMFEPSSGLWNSMMERTDGKVPNVTELTGAGGKDLIPPANNAAVLDRVNQLLELAKQRKEKDAG